MESVEAVGQLHQAVVILPVTREYAVVNRHSRDTPRATEQSTAVTVSAS